MYSAMLYRVIIDSKCLIVGSLGLIKQLLEEKLRKFTVL